MWGAGAAHAAPARRICPACWENVGWRELQQQSGDVSGTGGSPGTRGLLGGATGVLTGGPGLFFDIATGVPGGLPLQPWAAALKQQRMAANSKDNPDAHCLPLGNMQLHTHPQPRKIVQTPDVIVILYEGNAGVRQTFHRRPAAAGRRSAAVVVRLLHGTLGRATRWWSRRPASATAAGST